MNTPKPADLRLAAEWLRQLDESHASAKQCAAVADWLDQQAALSPVQRQGRIVTDLPLIAPSGKSFAVSHQMSIVIDAQPAPVKDVVRLGRFNLREDAEREMAKIDWRLNPCVILVDRETS